MKANQLRLGNWIINERWRKESSNKYNCVDLNIMSKIEDNIGDYKPIPLTEEWLLKFCFIKLDDNHFTIGVQDFSYHLVHSSINGFINGGYFMGIRYDDWDKDPESIFYFEANYGNVRHVHQLQNLYFSLTGEELVIKK